MSIIITADFYHFIDEVPKLCLPQSNISFGNDFRPEILTLPELFNDDASYKFQFQAFARCSCHHTAYIT